jgi:hypothetical protein
MTRTSKILIVALIAGLSAIGALGFYRAAHPGASGTLRG